MDNRYRLLEVVHARNLDSYNQKMDKLGKPRMPRVVLLIDELADLMISAPDETEGALSACTKSTGSWHPPGGSYPTPQHRYHHWRH
jgi:hypothetical protein